MAATVNSSQYGRLSVMTQFFVMWNVYLKLVQRPLFPDPKSTQRLFVKPASTLRFIITTIDNETVVSHFYHATKNFT